MAFNTATALTALVSAAAITEQNHIYLEIKHLRGEPSHTVFALRPGGRRPAPTARRLGRRSQDD
ncbi:hypothetical protein RKD23_007738 [Streptomyces sp. SAI-170]|uniref:hypothetical protein n=1 Tax=Streptomyces sp. SAI-170 TaxID=3377729 RepID=UPI003C7C5DC4